MSWSNPLRGLLGLRLSFISFARVTSLPLATGEVSNACRADENSPICARCIALADRFSSSFCLPQRRLRDCATAPCTAHSKENSTKVTQSPVLNAANLSSNLLRGMRPPRDGLQSNILGNKMEQFPSTCGGLCVSCHLPLPDLLQTDFQSTSKRPFQKPGTDFMTNARTSNTFSTSKLSNPVAMDRRSGRKRMSWTGSPHSTCSSSACSD